MKLKQASLIAIIGCIVGFLANIIAFVSTVTTVDIGLGVSYYANNLLTMIMEISLILFFITLYKNQK